MAVDILDIDGNMNNPALLFDNQGYVNLNTNLYEEDTFTIEIKLIPHEYTENYQCVLGEFIDWDNALGLRTGNIDNGYRKYNFYFEENGDSSGNILIENMIEFQEYHLAIVYDGNNLTAYKDGNQVAQVSPNISTPNLANDFKLGGNFDMSSFNSFNGIIKEVRLWTVARSQTEIQNNLENTLTGDEIGLQNYYKCNDNSSTLTDYAGNNDGNGSNLKWVDRYLYEGTNNQTRLTTTGLEIAHYEKQIPFQANEDFTSNFKLDTSYPDNFNWEVTGGYLHWWYSETDKESNVILTNDIEYIQRVRLDYKIGDGYTDNVWGDFQFKFEHENDTYLQVFPFHNNEYYSNRYDNYRIRLVNNGTEIADYETNKARQIGTRVVLGLYHYRNGDIELNIDGYGEILSADSYSFLADKRITQVRQNPLSGWFETDHDYWLYDFRYNSYQNKEGVRTFDLKLNPIETVENSNINWKLPFTHDYYIKSAGNNDGNAETILYSDGTNHSKDGRGLNLARFDSNGNFVEAKTYDTHGSETESHNCADYINGLPAEDLLMVGVKDQASSTLTDSDASGGQLTQDCIDAISNRLSSNHISSLGYRESWLIFSEIDGEKFTEKWSGGAKEGKVSWTHKVTIETSVDGGTTWQEATNGGSIPNLPSDVSSTTLKVRVTLVSDDFLSSSVLRSLNIEVYTAETNSDDLIVDLTEERNSPVFKKQSDSILIYPDVEFDDEFTVADEDTIQLTIDETKDLIAYLESTDDLTLDLTEEQKLKLQSEDTLEVKLEYPMWQDFVEKYIEWTKEEDTTTTWTKEPEDNIDWK